MRLHLLALILVPTIAVLFVACGGDDDDSNGEREPTATGAPTASEAGDADGDGQDGDNGDDDGSATGAPDFSEDFGMSEAGSGGSGSVVLAGDTLEYDVVVCSEEDGVYTMSGRGHTAAGEPFVAEVAYTFGFEATAEVSIGSSSVSDEGQPHWTAEPMLNYSAGQDGFYTLRFDSQFTDSTGTQDPVDGSVDVRCQP